MNMPPEQTQAIHDVQATASQPVFQQQVVIQTGKSVGVAALLGFFFGPLGMLYSTILGALIMFVIAVVVAVVTLGIGLLAIGPICAVWAALAADAKNSKLRHSVNQSFRQPAATAAPGWYQDPEGSGRQRWWDGNVWTAHYGDEPGISTDR